MNDNAQPAARARKPWPAVFSIAVSSFSLVSAEFLPVGLLNAMAADLGISVGTAGLLVAASGLLAAISAPALTILAGQRDRRQVLLALSLLLTLSNLLSMTATGLPAMLAARVLLGIAVGGFWSLGASTANRLAPAGSEARATSVVYAGISVGIVLGVPLGTLIGQELGWRNAFAAASVVSALAYAVQYVSLPTVTQATRISARQLFRLAARPAIMQALLITVLAKGTQFATTYVEPYLSDVTAASGYFITLALLVYGGAGVIGSLLGGMGADRTLRGTLAVVLAAATSALALLCVAGSSSAVALFCLLVWGAAFGALPLCLQLWIMRLAGDELEGGAALFVTCVQSSIAIGSALGGQLVNHYGAARTWRRRGAVPGVAGVRLARHGRARHARPRPPARTDQAGAPSIPSAWPGASASGHPRRGRPPPSDPGRAPARRCPRPPIPAARARRSAR